MNTLHDSICKKFWRCRTVTESRLGVTQGKMWGEGDWCKGCEEIFQTDRAVLFIESDGANMYKIMKKTYN